MPNMMILLNACIYIFKRLVPPLVNMLMRETQALDHLIYRLSLQADKEGERRERESEEHDSVRGPANMLLMPQQSREQSAQRNTTPAQHLPVLIAARIQCLSWSCRQGARARAGGGSDGTRICWR